MFYILDLLVTFRQFYNRLVIVIIAIVYRKACIFKGLKSLAKE